MGVFIVSDILAYATSGAGPLARCGKAPASIWRKLYIECGMAPRRWERTTAASVRDLSIHLRR